MFSDNKTRFLVLFWALAAVCGCSVLEDRSDCPCFVHLDFSDSRNSTCDSLLVRMFSPGGFEFRRMVRRAGYEDGLSVGVPSRNGVYITVLDGAVEVAPGQAESSVLRIPFGEQCPEVYMYTSFLDTARESAVDSVKVGKNYCGVSMNFISGNLDLYQVRIVGNVCGYASGGMPLYGDFDYCPELGPQSCYFRIPRQWDSSLELVISTPDAPARVFALGNYILQSGYDWNSYDLEDIVMTVNFAQTSIIVTINEWSVEEHFDVVI